MKFVGSPDPEERVYRCECGNEAGVEAIQAFASAAGAYMGAPVTVDPAEGIDPETLVVHSER